MHVHAGPAPRSLFSKPVAVSLADRKKHGSHTDDRLGLIDKLTNQSPPPPPHPLSLVTHAKEAARFLPMI